MASFFGNDFWGRVRQRMMDQGISMKELSKMTGLPYGSIYRQINLGIVPTKPEYLNQLALVLGTTVDYLLTGEKIERNKLSPELESILVMYKNLTDEQKTVIRMTLHRFEEDNQKYAEVYLQLHPVE